MWRLTATASLPPVDAEDAFMEEDDGASLPPPNPFQPASVSASLLALSAKMRRLDAAGGGSSWAAAATPQAGGGGGGGGAATGAAHHSAASAPDAAMHEAAAAGAAVAAAAEAEPLLESPAEVVVASELAPPAAAAAAPAVKQEPQGSAATASAAGGMAAGGAGGGSLGQHTATAAALSGGGSGGGRGASYLDPARLESVDETAASEILAATRSILRASGLTQAEQAVSRAGGGVGWEHPACLGLPHHAGSRHCFELRWHAQKLTRCQWQSISLYRNQCNLTLLVCNCCAALCACRRFAP
jgi:hypothetical protein